MCVWEALYQCAGGMGGGKVIIIGECLSQGQLFVMINDVGVLDLGQADVFPPLPQRHQ